MADEQVDTSDTKSVGSKLGEALMSGIRNISSGLNNAGINRDMMREVGRSMLVGGIAAKGSNAAILSGDPTYALEGQKMAAAVDKSIQQHWWITKAKEFEKEKLKPMSKQFEFLKRDFDTKMSEIQGKFGDISSKYGVDREKELETLLEDEKSKGTLTPERADQILNEINNIKNKRNEMINGLTVEYTQLVSNFNTTYGNTVMQIMNDAQIYDPSNPILANMVGNLVDVIGAEAQSFHSALSTGAEAQEAIQTTDQTMAGMGSRMPVSSVRRIQEAKVTDAESTARVGVVGAAEAERDFGLLPEQDGKAKSPAEAMFNTVKQNMDRGRTEGQAIEAALQNPEVRQGAAFLQDDVYELGELLGYGEVDQETGEWNYDDDIMTANEANKMGDKFASFLLATKVIRDRYPHMTVAEATDHLDNIAVKEGVKIPTAVTLIQERLAKDNLRIAPEVIIRAMDAIQKEDPNMPVLQVIGETANQLLASGGRVEEKDKKGLLGTAEKAATSALEWFRTKASPAPKPKQSGDKKGLLSPTAETAEADSKPPITPEVLIANVNNSSPADHGKVYGALLKLKSQLQEEAKKSKSKDETDNKLARIRELNAFISVYETQFPRKLHKEFYELAGKFLTSNKTPDQILKKHGF